jgi:rare lipoprotein A (peptidoglycan hydrolase)
MRGTPVRLVLCGIVGAGLATIIAHGVGDATIDPHPAAEAASAATDDATGPVVKRPAGPTAQVGIASWYGLDHQGRLTASGRRFDRRKLTAAHPSLPLNSEAKVTNLDNGRSVEVTINDRGPGAPGRAIDLSERAAQRLGMKKVGLAPVVIEPLANGAVASR